MFRRTRLVDHVKARYILNFRLGGGGGGGNRGRPVSIILEDGRVDVVRSDDGKKAPKALDWRHFPDESVSQLVAFMSTADPRCFDGVAPFPILFFTLRAAIEIGHGESEILLTQLIFRRAVRGEIDLLSLLGDAVKFNFRHLLLLLDCEICARFSSVDFASHYKRLTVDDLYTWLDTEKHHRLPLLHYLSEHTGSVYECDEEVLFSMVFGWIGFDVARRHRFLPSLTALLRWSQCPIAEALALSIPEILRQKRYRRVIADCQTRAGVPPRHRRQTLCIFADNLVSAARPMQKTLDDDDSRHLLALKYLNFPVDVTLAAHGRLAVVKDDVYFAFGSSAPLTQIYRLNYASGRLKLLPSPRRWLTRFVLCSFDEKLLLVGGRGGDGTHSRTIEKLGVTKRRLRWKALCTVPHRQRWLPVAACQCAPTLLCCWIYDEDCRYAVRLYDTLQRQWRPFVAQWSKGKNAAMGVPTGIVYPCSDKYVILVENGRLHLVDLKTGRVSHHTLEGTSQADVAFDWGFFRYNVNGSGAVDAYFIVSNKQYRQIDGVLVAETLRVEDLVPDVLHMVVYPNYRELPLAPRTCLVDVLRLNQRADDTVSQLWCSFRALSRSFSVNFLPTRSSNPTHRRQRRSSKPT